METLILVDLVLAIVGLLIVLFVAFPYRRRPVPAARRLGQAVASVAEHIDPGEAPPLGVLTKPEGSRRMSRRFERAERRVRRLGRVLRPSPRDRT